ncbi:MAG: hypothetical protein J5737_04160 [Bacteroidales bacterium]|nr:hypothetical protein [Bacteroidales bacterium]
MLKKNYISPFAEVEEKLPDSLICDSLLDGLGNEDIVDSGHSIEWE